MRSECSSALCLCRLYFPPGITNLLILSRLKGLLIVKGGKTLSSHSNLSLMFHFWQQGKSGNVRWITWVWKQSCFIRAKHVYFNFLISPFRTESPGSWSEERTRGEEEKTEEIWRILPGTRSGRRAISLDNYNEDILWVQWGRLFKLRRMCTWIFISNTHW